MPSENYNARFEHLSRLREIKDIEEAITSAISQIHRLIKVANAQDGEWKQRGIQHTCSASGGGEEILPISRFLRTACVTKEKLLGITQQYLLLEAMLRIKTDGARPSPLLNIKAGNIQKKVDRTLSTLDSNIRDMECDLILAEKMRTNERGNIIEVTDQLTRIEQRIGNIELHIQASVSKQHSIRHAGDAERGVLKRNQEGTTAVEAESRDDDHPIVEAAGFEEEVDDDQYLDRLFAESIGEDAVDATNTQRRPAEPDVGQGTVQEVMEAAAEEAPTKTKKRRRLVSNTNDQEIQALEKDLDDLRFGFTYLPRRKIGGAAIIGETSAGIPRTSGVLSAINMETTIRTPVQK
ncbi:hypothetical protein Y032_0636g941 [Ancylostoma ceylanicum]|uniref:Uncharacterized protein n=1 Tax=Ancylostoma ceylanicum TaxID=53326 RepID=A0A016WK06_9BILA|nr:hypothetical protein Y032_0636g941 [Ancylostoma ceylanicum]